MIANSGVEAEVPRGLVSGHTSNNVWSLSIWPHHTVTGSQSLTHIREISDRELGAPTQVWPSPAATQPGVTVMLNEPGKNLNRNC